ncbi:MAG TPA: methylmalonyl-CoA mutase family protein [Polyangiales bacterium]
MRPSYRPAKSSELLAPARVVTAASLFDGHDAAINIVRRLLQVQGAEVIHLGHDRSVDEIVTAAIQEDAHAVAVSSYQGGHMEFFRYLVDQLRERGSGHVRVYGGGGGTILPEEIAELTAYGVAHIFTPEEGRTLGLPAIVASVLGELDTQTPPQLRDELSRLSVDDAQAVARVISCFEHAAAHGDGQHQQLRDALATRVASSSTLVVGVTGTGGAGKSSVVDELVLRLRRDFPALSIGLLLVDPSKRRTGGALLGDRIRMNALALCPQRTFARSMATRRAHVALSAAVADATSVLHAAGYDLVIVETAGIGQSDSAIVDLAQLSLYVMTPEYGAPSQLEKIDMLELADLIVLNKADRRGAQDALRDVRKQWKRNHDRHAARDDELPVYLTCASRFGDPGMEALYAALLARLRERGAPGLMARAQPALHAHGTAGGDTRYVPLIPGARVRYLAEISAVLSAYREQTEQLAHAAGQAQALGRALLALGETSLPLTAAELAALAPAVDPAIARLRECYLQALTRLDAPMLQALTGWPQERARYAAPSQSYVVRGRAISADNFVHTLAGTSVPRVALPTTDDWPTLVTFLRREGLPGHFPFTAGVFAFKQRTEDPTRMFAGEGAPERTNRRFHLLASGQRSVRLSTAFDSVTLYGRDPAAPPDVYGKVGNSGVSVATLDDAKKLYSGFDLCAPSTSVSMTINGPAPVVLAFFLNAAIDQQVEAHLRATGKLDAVRAARAELPSYRGELPSGHSGIGLGLLGIPGHEVVEAEVYARIAKQVLGSVRGTVQADILKEDQAQNTCIFSIDFALRLMGDVQAYFIEHAVHNFYSVSVSGYHIAEAGANPITQLAFTLANAFTYVEHYRARGMQVDDFAPNFSFFFSHGLDAEYSVLGRVARRIWAVAMRDVYGASERSQKLKYHIQTSGRSLHAQEMAWNDIRTTLQAFSALADHCNSLHTNAYDEAVTTPTAESVRTAVAIQLILSRELGLLQNENPLQGSYLIEALSERVEQAVLQELERLSERGGVLGSMETLYQRNKIQDESLLYETRKHSGELPIVGVNTFVREQGAVTAVPVGQTVRASDEEKRAQLQALQAFHARNQAQCAPALARLQAVAAAQGNVFAELMHTVRYASLGQITEALFAVGGRYRRSM